MNKKTSTLTDPMAQNSSVSGSVVIALNIIFDLIEYGQYKAYNSDVGERKAQEIQDEFHKGKYGSKNGFWVQVKDAYEVLAKHYR